MITHCNNTVSFLDTKLVTIWIWTAFRIPRVSCGKPKAVREKFIKNIWSVTCRLKLFDNVYLALIFQSQFVIKRQLNDYLCSRSCTQLASLKNLPMFYRPKSTYFLQTYYSGTMHRKKRLALWKTIYRKEFSVQLTKPISRIHVITFFIPLIFFCDFCAFWILYFNQAISWSWFWACMIRK